MIREYAVEPEGMDSFEVIMNIANLFSASEGRFISRFPSKWLALVYSNVENLTDGLKKKIIVERLADFKKHKILLKTNRAFDDSINWIENVVCQQEKLPFYAVITKKEEDIENSLTFVDAFDKEHSLMRVNRTPRVRRTSEQMSKAISNLLQFSKHIIFVDSYFENLNGRHINPFIEFLNVIANRQNNIPIHKIEYHCGSGVKIDHFKSELNRRVQRRIPNGLKIDILRWPSEKLHNRYILTDLAGVMFGIGLDEDTDGSKPYDEITLLDGDTYSDLWRLYNDTERLEKFSL